MIGIVATLKIKPGMEQPFEAVAKELVAKVNANEPGCRLYALHHGEQPNTYVFMERYADQAAVDAHRATDHYKALGRKMGEYLDGRAEVLRLREVE
jgi:quinol monooxygenase YgiN